MEKSNSFRFGFIWMVLYAASLAGVTFFLVKNNIQDPFWFSFAAVCSIPASMYLALGVNKELG